MPHPLVDQFRFTRSEWLRRVTYHYWYHLGEIQAIRQMLGQTNLPEYVGNTPALACDASVETEAPYRPE